MIETNGTPVMIGENGGFGLGGGLGVLAIIIIAMMFFRGGFFGGNGGGDNTAAILAALGANRGGQPQYATSNEVQRGFDNQNQMANQQAILSAVTSGTAQAVAATNQTFHDMLSAFGDKYAELQRDVGNVQLAQAQALANQNQCCSETKMLISETGNGISAGIAQNRYEAALNTAAIQKTIVEEAQKNRDLYTGNRMADMQSRINRLEMNEALCGIPRFQPNYTYGAAPSPFGGGPVPQYPYYPAA